MRVKIITVRYCVSWIKKLSLELLLYNTLKSIKCNVHIEAKSNLTEKHYDFSKR